MATSTDARGKVTSYSYTAQGLPLAVTSPADAAGVQPVTTYGYTAYLCRRVEVCAAFSL